MRIWDVSPGYLNRASLLGEHRELHAVVSVLVNRKRGYAAHPETRRWAGRGWALRQRHRLLAAEMALRGYTDRSPVRTRSAPGRWPDRYLDEPAGQLRLLRSKYIDKEQGRMPLPATARQLWDQHRYSALARDALLYKRLGREAAATNRKQDFDLLARRLTELLRRPPTPAGLADALQHMWGRVSGLPPGPRGRIASWTPRRLLAEIRRRAIDHNEPYLKASTALGELEAWLPVV